MIKNEKLVSFLLRIGLAVVFLFAAVESFLKPDDWTGFFPLWLREIVPVKTLLFGFSSYEILLALWLLSGKKTFYASLLTAITLLAIITQNIKLLDIVFRDIAILFGALALCTLTYKNREAHK